MRWDLSWVTGVEGKYTLWSTSSVSTLWLCTLQFHSQTSDCMCRCLLHVRFSCRGKHISLIFHAFSTFPPSCSSSALTVTLVLLVNSWKTAILYVNVHWQNLETHHSFSYRMIFKIKGHPSISILCTIKSKIPALSYIIPQSFYYTGVQTILCMQ